MSQLEILEYPDPVLRKAAEPVTEFDATFQLLIDNLTETLYNTSGIGLCAPQVGHSVQLFVMDLSDDKSKPEFFINPRIIAKSGLGIAEEACLSIPGVAAKIFRSGVIHVAAQDRHGKSFEVQLDGMSAICVQHEIDHLQGILFVDRLSRLRKFRFRRALRSLENNSSQTQLQTTA